MQNSVRHIARKELASFFSSPAAFIFLGAFLAVNLFVFFWVEAFFARNIADVRPLFEWMPILMLFLTAALTMRMWSEERRMGTMELLLTMPVNNLKLVAGKFTAALALVVIALILTLPIPITVSLLGDLDWGPVLGGYIASIFLAGAYIAVGLFVSSKTENQIVSLMLTVLVCFILYLLGSDALTPLLGNRAGEFFKLLGTGSRFGSITRGVIDLRDIYYYLSIIGVFATLNILGLEKIRWSTLKKKEKHSRWQIVSLLFVVNFLLANFWLDKVGSARVDLTQGSIYSISDATRNYLARLQEPLLIRGYFSSKTHPLLAPLVPSLRDLIKEYQIAGKGKVHAEFIDPREKPELEEEANRKYNIKPVPFQISDKYQSSLVNSYFDILIQYGDKFEVLNFRDLIEVQFRGESDIDIQLKNPEYELTRAIKKTLYGFESTDHLFASMAGKIQFTGFISPDEQLPETLREFKGKVTEILEEFKTAAGDKLEISFHDPKAGDGAVAKEIAEQFGFRPMKASLFDTGSFYFYMLLKGQEQLVLVPLPQNLDEEGLRRSLSAAFKRFSSGFLKTVGLVTPPAPPANPYMMQMGMQQNGKDFKMLWENLTANHMVRNIDLKDGVVPDDIDLLLVAAPENLDSKKLFAIDQFLMKGGTVFLSTSPFSVTRSQTSLKAEKKDSGLTEWLKHHGLNIKDKLVLDPQNEAYPVPMQRKLGAFTVEELKMVQYPFFVDIRADGMNKDLGLTAGIPQVTLNWPSPIELDKDNLGDRKVTELFRSTDKSWLSTSTKVLPNFSVHGEYGFAEGNDKSSHLLAVLAEGTFESFFKDKENPLFEKKEEEEKPENPEKPEGEKKEEKSIISGIIEKSPESARLILFATNEFLADMTLRISASSGSSRYLNSLQLAENAIDWSLEDRGLLSIRSREHFSRTLETTDRGTQIFWEYFNYALALLGLFIVYLVYRWTRKRAIVHCQRVIQAKES